MISFFTDGVSICFALTLAIGWPMSVLLGVSKDLRSIGFAAAAGLSLALIVCRAVQVWFPIGHATEWLWFGYFAALGALWLPAQVRHAGIRLIKDHGIHIAMIGIVLTCVIVALNEPILFGKVIQFDGSRNADSFTWTSNARYMLDHSFDGSPKFDLAHPVYSITGSYVGDNAIQPRIASEGFLAWLSATWGLDPMYLFNAVQTAGMLLGALSLLLFLPDGLVRSKLEFAILLPLLLASPAVIFIAVNSNFPNGLTLAAAAGYLGLGVLPRKPGTFVAALLFLGCLISGYPELMLFIGAIRVFATAGECIAGRSVSWALRELGMLALELIVVCALLPWATKGALVTYTTMLTMSHAGATDQTGNMYAGVPIAIVASALLVIAWRPMRRAHEERHIRILFVSVLLVFAMTQLAMIARGYAYGGFKLSEYFAIPLAAATAVCSAFILSEAKIARSNRFLRVGALVVLAIVSATLWLDTRMIKRSWAFAEDRSITNDLIAARNWIQHTIPDTPIAKGSTPVAFYYGQWLPYVVGARFVYDWRDPDAAGYLSPYLRQADTGGYRNAGVMLSIDNVGAQHGRQASDVAVFGRVHLSEMNQR